MSDYPEHPNRVGMRRFKTPRSVRIVSTGQETQPKEGHNNSFWHPTKLNVATQSGGCDSLPGVVFGRRADTIDSMQDTQRGMVAVVSIAASSDTGTGTNADAIADADDPQSIAGADQNPDIRTAYRKHGRPPTSREVATVSDVHGHDSYYIGSEPWDDVLRRAGVPGRDDIVGAAIRKLWSDRYPWQDAVRFQAGDLDIESDIARSIVGTKIRQIADGDRTPDETDGLTIEKCVMGSGHIVTWEVRA